MGGSPLPPLFSLLMKNDAITFLHADRESSNNKL